MTKDIDPATVPAAAPVDDKPFVRVYRDKDTGNTLLALNADAVDALLTILDVADLGELRDNPGYRGFTDDSEDARLAADVGFDILGQLKKLAPYIY